MMVRVVQVAAAEVLGIHQCPLAVVTPETASGRFLEMLSSS